MKFLFRSEAAADVVGAREWYEAQREGLGKAFADALEHVLSAITAMPESFPVVRGDVRRALLRRFPYALYYRLRDSETAEVIACLHTRRSPHILRTRK